MSIGNAKTPSANVVSSTLSADNRKKINEMIIRDCCTCFWMRSLSMAIGQFVFFLCFLNFSYMFLCVETELLVNFELFLCGNWAMIYFCLVETERGGVINLLHDNQAIRLFFLFLFLHIVFKSTFMLGVIHSWYLPWVGQLVGK